MFKGKKFELRPVEEIKQDVEVAKKIQDRIKELAWKSGYGDRTREVAATVLRNPPNHAFYNVACGSMVVDRMPSCMMLIA